MYSIICGILGMDPTRNVSFYTVPAALALTLGVAAYGMGLAGRSFDGHTPRNMLAAVEANTAMDKRTKSRIGRVKATENNMWETLAYFAAGVVAANVTGVAVPMINALSTGYVLARVGYIYTYIQLQEDRRFAPLRSFLWMGCIAMSTALWVTAGGKAVAA